MVFSFLFHGTIFDDEALCWDWDQSISIEYENQFIK